MQDARIFTDHMNLTPHVTDFLLRHGLAEAPGEFIVPLEMQQHMAEAGQAMADRMVTFSVDMIEFGKAIQGVIEKMEQLIWLCLSPGQRRRWCKRLVRETVARQRQERNRR